MAPYAIPEDIKGAENILGYYWANQFAFIGGNSNGVDGYMGIQTVGDIHTFDPSNRNIPTCNRFVKRARIALFSVWGAIDANPGPTNSYCAPFGHEGSGWSCKVEYLWRAGVKYCLQVEQLQGAKELSEPAWWRGVIIDTSTRQETIIGDIQVPAEWSWLRKDASCFTEYFSAIVKQEVGDEDDGKPNPRVCEYMPKAEVVIYPPQANNGSVTVLTMIPKNYGKCAGVSTFTCLKGDIPIPNGTRIMPAQPLLNRTGSMVGGL